MKNMRVEYNICSEKQEIEDFFKLTPHYSISKNKKNYPFR